jgi:cytochrome c
MIKIMKFTVLLIIGLLLSCGGKSEKNERKSTIGSKAKVEEKTPASKRITLDNKGVGEIKNVELAAIIDDDMAKRGASLFNTNCTACHKTDKRFIGPNPTGILERRSPEWIMNMILDPNLMTEEDQCAKDLLVEFNGAAMANQNLTKDQARDILEYFRTLK